MYKSKNRGDISMDILQVTRLIISLGYSFEVDLYNLTNTEGWRGIGSSHLLGNGEWFYNGS